MRTGMFFISLLVIGCSDHQLGLSPLFIARLGRAEVTPKTEEHRGIVRDDPRTAPGLAQNSGSKHRTYDRFLSLWDEE